MRRASCLLLMVVLAAMMVGCAQKEQPQENQQPVLAPNAAPAEGVVAAKPAEEAPAPVATPAKEAAPVADPVPAPKPVQKMFSMRIDCGSEKDFTDPAGNVWKADQNFAEGGWGRVGGDITERPEDLKIDKTDMPALYRTEAFGMDAYRVTCPNGTYTVVLHFAETYRENAGERIFGISVEGKKVVENLDVVKDAGGPLVALVKKFPDVQVTDGEATIGFIVVEENPEINGIEIIQTK
jgi:hypothetical protein